MIGSSLESGYALLKIQLMNDPEQPYAKRVEFFINHTGLKNDDRRRTVLVVGCGNGYEASSLRKIKPTLDVIGLDINLRIKKEHAQGVEYVVADGQNLPFRAQIADYCYCYHVVEHVSNHSQLLGEMTRVLRSKGELYLATPNSKRFLLYLMSAQGGSISSAIRANTSEWVARIRGEFIPEKGYHCGFTEYALRVALRSRFRKVGFLSEQYDTEMSSGTIYAPIVKLLKAIHALRFIGPSHTVLCQQPIVSD
jgi:ubiquinone/menaquinone biosynthesis C-methylase UbiE